MIAGLRPWTTIPMAIEEAVLPDNTPIGNVPLESIPAEPHREAPGFFRSIVGEALEYNPEINIATGVVNKFQDLNAMFDERPDGWNQFNYEALENSNPEDWGDILSGATPKQQQLIKDRRNEERADREWLSDGNWAGRLIGGAVGWTASMVNKIPIAGQFKSLSKAESFIKAAAKATPGLVAQSAVVNATRQLSNDTLGLDDWFLDTMKDSVFAAGIFGAVSAKGALNLQGRLKGLKYLYDDIDYVAKTDAEGGFAGWEATEAPGGSVGAARVSEAQKFVDQGLDIYGESTWFKKAFSFSPVVKMATSQFLAVREWGDIMFRPSNILKVKSADTFGHQSAEQMMKGLQAGAYNSERLTNSLWEDYVGIDSRLPVKDSLANVKKKLSQGNMLLRQEFKEQVGVALRNGDEHAIKEVSEASKVWRKQYQKLYDEAVKQDILSADLNPITAMSYLNRVHNKTKMNLEGEEWKRSVSEDILKQSQEINTWMGPITELRGQLKALKGQPKSPELKAARAKLREEIKVSKTRLEQSILDGTIDPILVSERPHFTKEQQVTLKELHAKEYDEVFELAMSGKIDKNLFTKTKKGSIKLKDPKDVPPLRKAVDERGASRIAEGSYNKILNQNEEQMMAQAFSDIKASSGSSPLKRRTLMVRDNTLEPWLVNDIDTLGHLYTNFMSRKIASDKALKSLGGVGTAKDELGGIINKLNKEFLQKKSVLEKMPHTKKRDKLIEKLTKEKDEGIDLMNKGWKAFWGNYNTDKYSPDMKSFLAGLRDWVAATGLGALPLMQLTDVAMMIREFGLGPTVKEGLFPAIKGIFNGNFKHTRADLAHANLGINTALQAYSDGLWGAGTQYHPRGWVSRSMANASSKLGNITGSNQFEDMMQHITGIISQSKTLSALKKYASGNKLSKVENERLNLLGLNQQEWADRILKQYDIYGGKAPNGAGKTASEAHIANYELWHDQEAAQVFLNSIKQEVDTVILKTNIADVPFCFRDPVVQSITMFMGYSFASTNARLLNLMQRPTANKVMGELLAMTIGAYIDPLRQYLSGREPDLSTEALMASAVTNGAPGGVFVDGFNRMNAIFDIPYLRKLKNDRYRGKGAASLLLGAPGTALDDIIRLIDTGANIAAGGTASESDVRRAFKAIPWTSAWEFRSPVNSFIESQNISKTRKRAVEGLFSE